MTCKCCIRVLYGPAIQRCRDPNVEADGEGETRGRRWGVEGRGTGKIVYSCLKLSGIDLLNGFNFRITNKNL